jgi:hypothetical protein
MNKKCLMNSKRNNIRTLHHYKYLINPFSSKRFFVESTRLFYRARDELLLTKDKERYDITRNTKPFASNFFASKNLY